MSLRLHSYAERRGDAATAARVVQEGLQTSWEQIWCPGLRLTVSYLRHGVCVSFASTAGGRDIRTTSTPRRPARTRTWAAAVDAIIRTRALETRNRGDKLRTKSMDLKLAPVDPTTSSRSSLCP